MQLTWEDFSKDGTAFTFRRTKTKDTQNENITIQLTDPIKAIIKISYSIFPS